MRDTDSTPAGFAPQASIDHAALRHNLRRVREHAPHSKVWAVIKANGYGHGMRRVANGLSEADGFAVARIDEALQLRRAGVNKPLLILEGVFDEADLQAAVRADCQLAVHHRHQIELLRRSRMPHPATVWLKVDTGMHRLGLPVDQVAETLRILRQCRAVRELNLMTHLANADDRADGTTRQQCKRFDSLSHEPHQYLSIANSAGLMAHPCARRDWVRPGIMLYGVSPFIDSDATQEGLLPVMTLRAPVIAVNRLHKGDPVGYGGIFRCPQDMPVAVIGVGYGDGYPRHAGNGTPVLLRGRRLPLVGRVSMDMLCADARGLPDLQIGEEATLWGKGLPVEEIARAAGTIGYELLCGVTGRVAFTEQNLEERALGAG
ncbi:MAG: alanine racemase [Gammaproteobacteria bacterium]|nr:alanine racemase [Gammaproteobacteria bacterium]